MLRVAARNLWGRKVRLFTTALAVTLGVSFLTGTMVFTDTISRTFNNVFSDVYKGTDTMVRGVPLFEAPENLGGVQRARVDASLVPTLRRARGVAAVDGLVLGYARLVAKNGEALGNPANGAPALGGSWPPTPRLNAFKVVSGAWASRDDEVVIDKGSAKKGDLSVGDTTTVLVQGGPQRVRISGIAKFGPTDSPGGASVVLFTQVAAQRLIAEPGKFDAIALAAAPGVAQQELVDNVRAVLPAGVEAVTGSTVIDEANNSIQKGMGFFRTFLLAFAVLAVATGAFMIFNTFSITVAQRNRENGLLRALGASRKQVLASVLLEALVTGVAASAVGIVLGLVIASGLKAVVTALGMEMPAGGLMLASKTVLWAMGVGVTATLFAAFFPARKAAKVAPVAAMHQGVATSTGYGSKERVFVGLGLLIVGIATVMTGVFNRSIPHPGWVALLGGAFAFFGVVVLGRTIALPMSRFTGWPLPRLRGLAGVLARENAMRNPKRTAATTAALMLCVTVVVVMNIIASSTRASIDTAVDKAFKGDFVVDPGGGMTGGVDHSLAQRLAALPEASVATSVRVAMAKVDGKVQPLIGADPVTGPRILDVRPRQGSMRDLGTGQIAVYEKVAKEKHLELGDPVRVLFKDTGEQTLRVALVYGENQPAGNFFIGMPAFEANVANRLDFGVYVEKAKRVTTADAMAAVKRVTKDYPGVKVLDQSAFKDQLAAPFNQILSLVYALILLMAVIALLSVGTTLALSIFERTRELGLLRAVGMTRAQLRSTVRWESVIISLQGSFVGLGLGVFLGWALLRVMNQSAGATVFSLPIKTLVGTVVVAGIAGVVSAILPARRAAKLDVLRAVVSE